MNTPSPSPRSALTADAAPPAPVVGWGAGRWPRALAWALGPALLAGCGPSPRDSAELRSSFFSRVEILGSRGVGPGQFNKPRSVALDREDNLYVVDLTGRVQKFTPSGEFVLFWQMPETDLGKAKGMGLDAQGRIVVIEPHYSRVNHFSTAGHLQQQWGTHGTNAGQLAFPRAVAVNSRGELFVSEYGVRERVQRFSPQGDRLLGGFGQFGSRPGEFNRAEGLGVDAQDRLHVADSCNHRVQVFDSAGRWLRAYGRPGTGLGELSYPYDVRIDAAGHEFVCEFGNSRIQVFDGEGRPQEIIGRVGSAPGQFNNPWSIALDSRGNLYVADAGNHRVQKLVRRALDRGATPAGRGQPALPAASVFMRTGVREWDGGFRGSTDIQGVDAHGDRGPFRSAGFSPLRHTRAEGRGSGLKAALRDGRGFRGRR